MITLYDCATAPSPRRARILLAEKGLVHDTVQVDLRTQEQMGEAYRRINPQCTVPALRTDEGALLTDNAAIAAYLEARYPEPPLFGRTPQDKAEIASLPGTVNYAQIPELAQRGLTRVQDFFTMLNERLEGRDFVAADQFSIADITAVVTVDFARVVKVKPGEQHPHLVRWRAAMALRPSMAL